MNDQETEIEIQLKKMLEATIDTTTARVIDVILDAFNEKLAKAELSPERRAELIAARDKILAMHLRINEIKRELLEEANSWGIGGIRQAANILLQMDKQIRQHFTKAFADDDESTTRENP
jgi:hypothetical protein